MRDDATDLARRRAYRLLGGLFLHGLRGAPDEIWTLPELSTFAPGSEAQRDRLEAAHHRLFGLEVAPYGSVWSEPRTLADEDTHLGVVAIRLGTEDAAGSAELDELLPWLLDLVAATDRLPGDPGVAFWQRLLHLVLGIAANHRHAAGGPPVPPVLREVGDVSDEPLPRELSRLAIPLVAGTFLSRTDLTRVAHALELPTGFGPRRELLRGMADAAVHYGQPDALRRVLGNLLTAAGASRTALAERLDLASLVAPWDARLAEARRRLPGTP